MQQLVDDGGLRLAGCVPQPPDPVAAEKLGDGPLPGHVEQLSCGGAPCAPVPAHHAAHAGVVEGLQLGSLGTLQSD